MGLEYNALMKQVLLAILIFFSYFMPGIFISGARAAEPVQHPVNLYLFWSSTCPHCKEEIEFLNIIQPKYPNLTVNNFEITQTLTRSYLVRIAADLGVRSQYVPITLIGTDVVYGYQDDRSTGSEIEDLILKYSAEGDPDPVSKSIGIIRPTPIPTAAENHRNIPDSGTPLNDKIGDDLRPGQPGTAAAFSRAISVPIIGSIKTESVSLPVLTAVIGMLDGFNPCAMWTLIFLISLLLGMKNRLRMWTLGLAFIITSAAVYFLFLAAWLNLFLFLGFIPWVRIMIGLLALYAGAYYLRDYLKNPTGVCAVAGDVRRRQIFERIRNITARKEFILALAGIIVLAVAVNMVELVCSAGLPAIYTQVLSMSNLETWQYYLYLFAYVVVFMLDDVLIFIIAMVSLEVTGLTGRYSRYSHLIGGILMLAIGMLMLFKPEMLMFGMTGK